MRKDIKISKYICGNEFVTTVYTAAQNPSRDTEFWDFYKNSYFSGYIPGKPFKCV